MKCEAEERNHNSETHRVRPSLIKSIHQLFNDTIPKANENELRDSLSKLVKLNDLIVYIF